MADNDWIDAILIPHDGAWPCLVAFPAAIPSTSSIFGIVGLNLDYCIEEEKRLRILPRLWDPQDSHKQTFSYKHRSLAMISAKDIEDEQKEWRADYLLYTCRDVGAALPQNEYLKKISDIIVYGDAYIFKVLEKQDGLSKVKFQNLELDFILALRAGEFPRIIVERLLTALPSEKKSAKTETVGGG